MSVRAATTADIPDLVRIGRQTFDETFGFLYTAKDLNTFFDENHTQSAYESLLGDEGYYVVLALDEGGEAVGYGVASRRCSLPPCEGETVEEAQRAGELKRMYVVAAAQGKGLGTLLMEELLTWHGSAKDIRLAVWSKNKGAHRFYGRYGFSFARSFEFPVGEHRDHEFVYRRLLSD